MKLSGLNYKAIWRNIHVKVALLLIVFFIFFSSAIINTIGQRFRTVYYIAKDMRSFYLHLAIPHAGEQVLPSAVQEMLALLRAHQLNSYRLSEKITKDPLINQRIVESAWPRRMSAESKFKFVFLTELDHSSPCREIDRRKEIALVFCY